MFATPGLTRPSVSAREHASAAPGPEPVTGQPERHDDPADKGGREDEEGNLPRGHCRKPT